MIVTATGLKLKPFGGFAMTELGHGSNHVCKDVPFVLAGATDVIEHGKVLSFDGEAHQKLLVAVGQAMGLTAQTFGKPQHSPGPLDGILKG